jgi:hypothetical protein
LIVLLSVFLCASAASAGVLTVEFQPNPLDLGDLDHSKAYAWGLDWTPPDPSLPVVDACLEIKNIRNWQVEPNILYIHLLDTTTVGVRTYSDTAWGDWFEGQGLLLTTFTDNRTSTSQPGVNFVYIFTPSEIGVLNAYLADGRFGFGFDPDCHFYNEGVKLRLRLDPCVPEPATLALFALSFPFAFRAVGSRRSPHPPRGAGAARKQSSYVTWPSV